MEVIEHYHYTKEHEWVNVEEETATIGISEYAQSNLGDITFIELPTVDTEVDQFEQIASVESVKAASDVFSPISGKVIEVNSELESDPSAINKNCYESGWIARLEVSDPDEISNLMTADDYLKYLDAIA